jgi:hypothetical protein
MDRISLIKKSNRGTWVVHGSIGCRIYTVETEDEAKTLYNSECDRQGILSEDED